MSESNRTTGHEGPRGAPEGAGQLTQLPGGGYRVTFVRQYEQPIEDLWAAISAPEGLDAWYPTKVRHDGVVGSRIIETFESIDGTPPPEVPPGVLSAYDPPHVFEMRVDGPQESEYPGMRGTQTIRMEASEAEGANVSRLVFTHDVETKETAVDVLGGWHWCLESLALHFGEVGDASKAYHDRVRDWYLSTYG